jgi:hypothetical protein
MVDIAAVSAMRNMGSVAIRIAPSISAMPRAEDAASNSMIVRI